MRKLVCIVLLFASISCAGGKVDPPADSDDPAIVSQDPSAEDPSAEDPSSEEPATKVVTPAGSFVQHWYVQSWSDSQWEKEMDIHQEAGMRYLILTPLSSDGADPDYACLEKCLKAASKRGIKVLVGPNSSSVWWKSLTGAGVLKGLMEEGLSIAAEAYSRLHEAYPEAFWGWYWDWEVDNVNWLFRKETLVDILNITLDGLSAIDPSMPLLLSPFMNPTLGSAADYKAFWDDIFSAAHFREGDIFSPQDCVGAAGMSPSASKTWFYQFSEAVKASPGLKLWANVEMFEQYNLPGETCFATASFDRMVRQVAAVEPFVEEIICFSYSHYYSPLLVREDYHKAFVAYHNTGTMPSPSVPVAVQSATRVDSGGAVLSWTIGDKTDVDGVAIYKNGIFLLKVQAKASGYPSTWTDTSGKESDTYQIATYNIMGQESGKVAFTK